MESSVPLFNNLLIWLRSLKVEGPQESVVDISDGIAIARALAKISPKYFNSTWISKIKLDVGNNPYFKMSNLRKINNAIIDYYDLLGLNILDDSIPDIGKIGKQSDLIELQKLLQLVLGCAVNCENKRQFMAEIMTLAKPVRQDIKKVIQIFARANYESSSVSLVKGIGFENTGVLAQKCRDLECQTARVSKETFALPSENVDFLDNIDMLVLELFTQIDILRKNICQTESIRDMYRDQIRECEKQISKIHNGIDEIQTSSDKVRRSKNEMNRLSERFGKVQAMAWTLASKNERLEDKKEEENSKYCQEEDFNNLIVCKSKMESYKSRLDELQQQLDEEVEKNVEMQMKNKKVQSKLQSVEREKDDLVAENNIMKNEIKNLYCIITNKKVYERWASNLEADENGHADSVKSLEQNDALPQEVLKVKQIEHQLMKMKEKIRNRVRVTHVLELQDDTENADNKCWEKEQNIRRNMTPNLSTKEILSETQTKEVSPIHNLNEKRQILVERSTNIQPKLKDQNIEMLKDNIRQSGSPLKKWKYGS